MPHRCVPGFLVFTTLVSVTYAQAPAPPVDLVAADSPNDDGTRIELTWELSPDDQPQPADGQRRVIRYEVLRSRAEGEAAFEKVAETTYQSNSVRDDRVERGQSYLYRVVAVGPDGTASAPASISDPVMPMMQMFDRSKAWFGILLGTVSLAIVVLIAAARWGMTFRFRKIAGLEAVDEAVGRATEMGRSCLFIPGILDINDIQTIAGLTVLSRVAGRCAEYSARLEVPTSRSLVMTAARETVQSAYLAAGRPDGYIEDNIYYLTDEQFGYVAGVTGSMVREKPAACFYMGAFFAESLILAETGNYVGSIQVAGTAMPTQLPFFVAACDYTLIGEEFFAASAYLSGEPQQLASLKGQDLGKLLASLLLLVGIGAATLASINDGADSEVLTFITSHMLGDRGLLP